jgi:hypothetical protein
VRSVRNQKNPDLGIGGYFFKNYTQGHPGNRMVRRSRK